MTDRAHAADPELEAAVWDLEPLVDGAGDAGLHRLLEQTRFRADRFAGDYAGRVAEFDANMLVRAADELAEIRDQLQCAETYAGLRAAADSADPVSTGLQAAAEELRSAVDTQLLFFDLEWVALDDDRAEGLLAAAGERLDFAAHHLRRLRSRRPYLLSPNEERILAETGVQRLAAWKRLFLENAATLMAEVNGETMPLTQAISLLSSPERETRRAAMAGIARGAQTGVATRVAAYNQVLGEKAVDDRLRGFPTWLSSRNLANETTDASVEALLEAVRARRDIPRRWNRLKAQLLGVEALATCDLSAPLSGGARTVSYARSRAIITSAWSALSPRAATIIDAFFSEGRIDAPIRAGKQGGAFCAEAGPSRSPYILVNYDSRPSETRMLAHELGHGLHFELARGCGALQYATSIPVIEFPSTFSEALVTDHQLADTGDDREALELLAARLDDGTLNVFGAATALMAEAAMHRQRRDHGELSADDLTRIWREAHAALWEDSIEIEDGYAVWWSVLPHMIMEPGYLYSYAYGLLTAWSAFARYKQVGDAFTEPYLAMLAAGGSRSPQELIAMIGLDLNDPGFWNAGLGLFDDMLDEAERLTAAL